LTAKITGKIVGMIAGVSFKNSLKAIALSDEFEIQNLVVDPEYRRSGVGMQLIQSIEDKALAAAFKKTVLTTLPSMKSAHKLYEKLGYYRNSQRDLIKNTREFLVFEKKLG
jgi:ribosomal protein S18 acetylase RimI-like enzyme